MSRARDSKHIQLFFDLELLLLLVFVRFLHRNRAILSLKFIII